MKGKTLIIMYITLVILFAFAFAISFYEETEEETINIKSPLIVTEETSDYGLIEIKNNYTKQKVYSIELKQNTDICSSEECTAETEVIMYEDGKLLDDIRFMDKNKQYEESIKSYNIYIKEGEKLTPYYFEEVKGNSTGIKYYVILKGKLKPLQTVDWQVKSKGTEWISEWAIWTSSLENGTMAWWKLDETSGTDAVDSLGDWDMDCNATNWTTGIIDNGLAFNGSANIGCTNETFLNGNNTDLTISMWIKHDYTFDTSRTNNLGTFSKVNELGVNHWYAFFNQATGALFMSYKGEGVGTDVSTPTVNWTGGTWYHIVYRWSKTDQNMSIWINGTNEVNTSFNNVMNDTVLLRDWEIGSVLSSANYFNGTIDEVGVWNRSLTSTEISNLYNASAGLTPDEIVIVTLNSPANNTKQHTKSLAANCTSESSENGIKNVSLYHNGTGTWSENQSSTSSGTPSTYEVALRANFTDYKTVLWSCYACNNVTPTECAFGENRTFYMKKLIINEENYSQDTIEGNLELFNINISTADLSLNNATFTYNNTEYLGVLSQTGFNYSITRAINIDNVLSNKNLTFNWSFLLSDDSVHKSTSHNQSVAFLGIDDCSVYTVPLFNFTIRDEDNQSYLGAAGFETVLDLDISIYTKGTTNEVLNFSRTYSQVNPARVCLSANLSDTEYRMDTAATYSALSKETEHHYLQNYTLTNLTTNQNISLYDLNSSKSQAFLIIYEDTNLLPVENALINIQREYLGDGLFRSVEIGKTDSNGQTIGHFVLNDLTYTLVVSKEGVTLATFENVVAFCDDTLTGDCKIILNQFDTGTQIHEWDTYQNLDYTLSFNETSRTIRLIFNTIDGSSASVTLNATKADNWMNETVCNDIVVSSSGTLTCVIPTSYGNVTVFARVYYGQSPTELITQAIYRIFPDVSDNFDGNVVIMLLIMIVTIPIMFITDTRGVIIGAVITLIMAGSLMIYTGYSMIGIGSSMFFLIVAGAIITWKISERSKS